MRKLILILMIFAFIFVVAALETTYNPFTGRLDYVVGIDNINISTGNITADFFFGDGSFLTNLGVLSSTFNSTYDRWAYNQSSPYDVFNYNMSDGNDGATNDGITLHINNITSFLYNYNQSSPYDIFNYNMSDGSGNTINGTTLSILNITDFLYNYNQSSPYDIFNYNQSSPYDTFNYNMSDGSFNSTYNQWAYNQSAPYDEFNYNQSESYDSFNYNQTAAVFSTEIWVDEAGDTMSGDLKMGDNSITSPLNINATGNISVLQNNYFCLNGVSCTKYIYYNGTAVIIQG